MKNIYRTIQGGFTKTLVNRKKYDVSQNYYIFSDPRGGSTWLMEIIQKITQASVICEPLHLDIKNSPFKKINFGWRQHIPENVEWLEAKNTFDKLFTGKILGGNILKHSSFSQLLNSKSLLFKFCRGSALLPWLTKNYSFSFKPIYLIRHPFAVVSSQLRHGAWNHSFSGYPIPDTAFNNAYLEHEPFLKTLKTKEEALVANWCLANYVPLKHSENNIKWLTINYEEFVLNPKKTINRILESWGMEYDLSTIDFKKNSRTTKKDSPELTIERLSNWEKHFAQKQLEDMQKVLDYFGIDSYSKNNPLPEKVFNYA